jgi:hypothetical protein
METRPETGLHLDGASRQVAQWALIICENHRELLLVKGELNRVHLGNESAILKTKSPA